VLHSIGGGSISENPAQISLLPRPEHTLIVNAFSHTLQTVFIVSIPIAVAAFIGSFFLREIPLRQQAHSELPEGPLVFEAPL
jgi:hypothetical protein